VRFIICLLAAGIVVAAASDIVPSRQLGRDDGEFLVDTTYSASPYQQEDPAVAFDGTNYLVVWEDYRNSRYDIYAARVTPGGAVLDPRGFAVSTAADEHRDPVVAFDGTNFLVVWADWRGGQRPNIYGARVTPGGAVLDTAGIAISTVADDQDDPAVCFDGANWLVAWGDHRDGSQYDLRAARVTSGGTVLDTAGIVISAATRNQSDPALVFDGTNTLAVWVDGRNIGNTANDIYCARVSPAGMVLDTAGIAVSRATRGQASPDVVLGDTNFLAAWRDDRSDDDDIYGARVTPDGTVLDTAGIVVCTADRTQNDPALAFDGTEFVAAWQDARGGTNSDIYGVRVSRQGVVYDEQPLAVRAGSRSYPALARGPGSQVLLVYQGYADTVGGRTYNRQRVWCKLDPVTGIEEEERSTPHAPRSTPVPTVVRGLLHRSTAGVLLDAAGARIRALRPGHNDLSVLAPGVYFALDTAGGIQATQKLVLQR
jgi:large repetitive protein